MSTGSTGAGRARLRGSRFAVVGGGLAGLTAALELSDAGASVVLCEARPRLGGATSSFDRSGLTVDTGQHVSLRCYDAYRRLLRRIGSDVDSPVQRRFHTPVLRPGHAPIALSRTDARAPLHLTRTLLHYAPLPVRDRVTALRAAAALRRVDPDATASDSMSFGHWLRAHGQSEIAINRLWELVSVAALNATADRVSLALAARVFRTGLLESTAAADLSIPTTSLGVLHGDAAARALSALGAQLRLQTKVERIERVRRSNSLVLRVAGREPLEVDGVVLAVPHQAAARIVPTDAAPGRGSWAALGADPIVNLHVIYSAPVTTFSFAAVVDSPVQWFFDRTAVSGSDGQYLAVSLSGAAGLIDTPTARLRQQFLPELARVLPEAGRTAVREFFVTRERTATFHQAPGCGSVRPGPATAWPELALAGAWTATGWPDTMEGAVRSGTAAVDSLAATLGPRAERPPARPAPTTEARR